MEHSDPTIPPRIRTDKILQKTLPKKIDLVIDHMRENQTKNFADQVRTPHMTEINGGIVEYSEDSKLGFEILLNEKQFKVRIHRYQSCPQFCEGFLRRQWIRGSIRCINTDGLEFKQPFKSARVNSFTFWCETSKGGKFKILNVSMKMIE